mmetsp:Transcript_4327/g.10777  ORF Transcript_4327/g.10777 Transcript_4327/m.10777 type:complete len:287 (-) Transcript_4327:239-1099(-)
MLRGGDGHLAPLDEPCDAQEVAARPARAHHDARGRRECGDSQRRTCRSGGGRAWRLAQATTCDRAGSRDTGRAGRRRSSGAPRRARAGAADWAADHRAQGVATPCAPLARRVRGGQALVPSRRRRGKDALSIGTPQPVDPVGGLLSAGAVHRGIPRHLHQRAPARDGPARQDRHRQGGRELRAAQPGGAAALLLPDARATHRRERRRRRAAPAAADAHGRAARVHRPALHPDGGAAVDEPEDQLVPGRRGGARGGGAPRAAAASRDRGRPLGDGGDSTRRRQAVQG